MLTNEVIMWYHTTSVQDEAPFCYGEMSERLKEPVLKTGEAQVSVGSNPTLSAKLYMDLQKYPRGRRGSPAKGVGWIKPARGFKSLLLRQLAASDLFACGEFLYNCIPRTKKMPPVSENENWRHFSMESADDTFCSQSRLAARLQWELSISTPAFPVDGTGWDRRSIRTGRQGSLRSPGAAGLRSAPGE